MDSQEDFEMTGSESLEASFFILHHIFSAIIFFAFAIWFKLFEIEDPGLRDLFSGTFYALVFWIFIFSVVSSFIGRFFAYLALKKLFKRFKDESIPKFKRFLRGINGMSFAFYVSSFFSALIFAAGIETIFRDILFAEDTLFAAIGTYVVLQIATYGISKMFSNWIIKKM